MHICVCIYMYVYIYTHTYIHTYMRTYIHTYIQGGMIEDRISSEAAALLNEMMYGQAARRKSDGNIATKSGDFSLESEESDD